MFSSFHLLPLLLLRYWHDRTVMGIGKYYLSSAKHSFIYKCFYILETVNYNEENLPRNRVCVCVCVCVCVYVCETIMNTFI